MKHRCLLLIIASAILTLSLSGCGTVRGIGQITGAAGHGIQKAAS